MSIKSPLIDEEEPNSKGTIAFILFICLMFAMCHHSKAQNSGKPTYFKYRASFTLKSGIQRGVIGNVKTNGDVSFSDLKRDVQAWIVTITFSYLAEISKYEVNPYNEKFKKP